MNLDDLKREAVLWYKERFDNSDIIGMPSDREVMFYLIDHLAARGMLQGWRGIESAPKDGRLFLVMLPRMMNLVVRARYDTIHKYFVDEFENGQSVSRPAFYHPGDLWCDIPPPPATDGEKP